MVPRSTDAERTKTMRNNTTIRHWSIVTTASALVFGVSGLLRVKQGLWIKVL